MKWRHYLFFEEKMKNELSVGIGLWLLTLSAKDGVGSLQGLRASGVTLTQVWFFFTKNEHYSGMGRTFLTAKLVRVPCLLVAFVLPRLKQALKERPNWHWVRAETSLQSVGDQMF